MLKVNNFERQDEDSKKQKHILTPGDMGLLRIKAFVYLQRSFMLVYIEMFSSAALFG